MRDKLIQILQKHTPRAMGGLYINTADEILAALRCDKCKHWTATGWRSGDMYCEKLERTTELTCISGEYGYDVTAITKADFFCALWEAKA